MLTMLTMFTQIYIPPLLYSIKMKYNLFSFLDFYSSPAILGHKVYKTKGGPTQWN